LSDDVYRRQQFGQRTGLGKTPALLVVDFVNGFTDPEIFGGGNIPEAVTATVPLLALARAKGLPIIFTRIVYAADGSDASLWCQKVPRLRELTEASPASHVVSELAPLPGELVIRKTQASAFFGTHLAACLVSYGVDSLIVTGCTTSGCVRATVVDAMSHNYRTVVVTDCVGDRALDPHRANLFDMGQKYSDLMRSSEVISILEKRASA
jgi:Amidases related to nicotinamidase